MHHDEHRSAKAGPTPVFVDDTGRRRALTRWVGGFVTIGFVGYLGLFAAGFAKDPRLGPLGLPTFGLPALHPDPAPAVLGEVTDRAGAEAANAGADLSAAPRPDRPGRSGLPSGPGTRSVPTGGTPGPAPASGTGAAPATPGAAVPGSGPAATTPTTPSTTTTAGAVHPGNERGAPATTTTSTTAPSSSSTTSSTTTTTTTMTPGHGAGPVSATGPQGQGPPGQARKATTTTTGPRR